MNDWENLARWLVRARGDRTQGQVIAATGISEGVLYAYENAQRVRQSTKLRKLAAHYGWTPDSIDRVLEGGEPTIAPADPLAGMDEPLTDEERAVLAAIANGAPTGKLTAVQRRALERVMRKLAK